MSADATGDHERASIPILAAKLRALRYDHEELRKEVLGTPGSQDSGLKSEIIKLRLEMKTVAWIGRAVGAAFLVDICSRLWEVLSKK